MNPYKLDDVMNYINSKKISVYLKLPCNLKYTLYFMLKLTANM